LGTRENWKKIPSPQNLKRKKKQGTLNACLGLPIGSMKFLFSKEFITIFGLGYYALQRTPYLCGVDNQTQLEKNYHPSHPQENKGGPLHSMTQLLIGCMEIIFLKLASTIF
jgi:hypothetical protein